jgi:hypothetical protein
MSTQPLDPRKSPWKRGDLCTRDFEMVGFVLSYTSEHLEIRWNCRNVEKISTHEIDDILRVAHADSASPDGHGTNLEVLDDIQALEEIGKAAEGRVFKNDSERRQADDLVRRSFATDVCEWDKRNSKQLLALALKPETVGIVFKLRERLHRLFCKALTQ